MKDDEIKAVLQTQTALLIALAKLHPLRAALLREFARLISVAIEAEPDPAVAGILQTLETQWRRTISGTPDSG